MVQMFLLTRALQCLAAEQLEDERRVAAAFDDAPLILLNEHTLRPWQPQALWLLNSSLTEDERPVIRVHSNQFFAAVLLQNSHHAAEASRLLLLNGKFTVTEFL